MPTVTRSVRIWSHCSICERSSLSKNLHDLEGSGTVCVRCLCVFQELIGNHYEALDTSLSRLFPNVSKEYSVNPKNPSISWYVAMRTESRERLYKLSIENFSACMARAEEEILQPSFDLA